MRVSTVRDWLCVGAVGVAVVGLGVFAARLNATPPPALPASLTPAPAQATLDDAYRRYLAVQKSARFLVLGDEVEERTFSPQGKRRLRRLNDLEAIAARQEVQKAHREALALVRRALGEAFAPPQADTYVVHNNVPERFDALYALGGLLSLSAQARADAGDLDGAADEALDVVALGTKLEQNAQWQGWQVAGATKYLGWQVLERLVPRLSPTQAARAAERLETLEAGRAPLAGMFQATRWAAHRTFQKKTWEQCMWDFGISYGPRSTLALKATPKAWIVAEHLNYLEALERHAKQANDPKAPLPSAPPDAFNQHLSDYFDQIFRHERLSRASAALTLARLRRHADPKATLPEDPFSPGKTLCERPDGLIYSAGPDGDDDGGVPLKRMNRSGDLTKLL